MKLILICLIGLICLICLSKIYYLDVKDRSNPFGLNDAKNKLYNFPSSEQNGVSTFWGKPNKNDSLLKQLNKIEWLSTNHNTEVKWRRSLFFGLLGALVLIVTKDYQQLADIKHLITNAIVISGLIYFSHIYYGHHVQNIKTKYISKHINKLKKQLDQPLDNNIGSFL